MEIEAGHEVPMSLVGDKNTKNLGKNRPCVRQNCGNALSRLPGCYGRKLCLSTPRANAVCTAPRMAK